MIRIECPRCGTRLRGPDEAAGTQIKCPKCAAPIIVPQVEPVYEAEPIYDKPDPYADDDLGPVDAYGIDDAAGPKSSAYSPADDGGNERRKPCPVCGEMIVATAAKCRFCGEVFDAKLKKASVKSKKKNRSRGDDDDISGLDIVICLLCPGIGCIAAIIYAIQGKGKAGKVFGYSALGMVLGFVLRVVIEASNR